jgi:DNA-binding winged helix-turn-helix (wHTH) protein
MRVAFGEYHLDTEARTLRCRDQRVSVQAKAFDLLAYLIEHRDRVISTDELLDALWPGLQVTPAALSTAVQKARRAVGDDGGHQAVLHTEHGKGFRFAAEASVVAGAEAAPAPLSKESSIPVLPFVNMSGNLEQEYFSDGITEELIHALTGVGGIRVVGRTSSFFFKGQGIDLRTIGEKPGVGNLLEGVTRHPLRLGAPYGRSGRGLPDPR